MSVLTMDIVCDNDTTGTVRGYLMHQKKSEKGKVIGKWIIGKKMCRNLSYRAGQRPCAAAFCSRQSLRCAQIPYGKIFLSGKMPSGRSNDGRVVYITLMLAADCLCNLRDRGSAGTDTPEEQGEYVNEA